MAVAIKVRVKHEIALQQKIKLEFLSHPWIGRQKYSKAAFPILLSETDIASAEARLLKAQLFLETPAFKLSETLANVEADRAQVANQRQRLDTRQQTQIFFVVAQIEIQVVVIYVQLIVQV